MKIIFILLQREIKSWAFSSVFYAHCILFSFFTLSAMFLLSGFIETNEADLGYTFFRWHPWILAMIAPVIGVRSWSEEGQCGVFEVLGTLPIHMSHVVIAKAIAAATVIFISLLCTFPAVITVVWLGKPDLGAISSAYIGSFLCGCAFVAVSQAVCAYMRVSIGAFVCSVALCLVLVTCGITQVANIILGTFPELVWMTELLAGISITSKFEPFIAGRIEASALLGFLLLIFTSLVICQRALLAQRGSDKNKLSNKFGFTYGLPVWCAVAAYVLLSLLFSYLPGYWDVTEGRRFNLPPAVVEELEGLERDVTVRLFATSSHPRFGFDLARYERRIRETLQQLNEESDNKVKIEILNPNINPRAARIAAIDEVKSYTYDNGDPFMFGMVVESLDKKRVFDSIDPQRERYFLADVVQAVIDVGRVQRNKIGVLSPFVERSDSVSLDNWTAFNVLSKSFDLELLEIENDWSQVDIVFLFHSNVEGDTEEYLSGRLKAFVEQGGDVVVMSDPLSLMSERFAGGGSLALRSSELPMFLRDRGISMRVNNQVFDPLLSTERSTEQGLESDPAFLGLTSRYLNQTHTITAGLDLIHVLHAGALDIKNMPAYTNSILASSSEKSFLVDVKDSLDGTAVNVEGVGIEKNSDHPGFALMVLQENNRDLNEGRIIVVSDVDWLYQIIAGFSNGDGSIDSHNANIGLMQNMFDYLAGDRSLSELRKHSMAKRPLEQWNEIQQSKAEPYVAPLSEISKNVTALEERLQRLDQARRVGAADVERSAKIERQVSTLRQELLLLNAEASSLRSKREASIQKLLIIIKWLNVLCVPLMLFILSIFILQWRARTVRGTGA